MITSKEVTSVLNKHKKRDSWFLDDYSVNPYEGCGFNCLYCYIRGSKYGENLAEKITIKQNAAAILDKQLAARARKKQYGFIAVGSATDAYMQVEEQYGETRKLLEIILKHRFPVFISTKSQLITRDLDLLEEISRVGILPEGFPASFAYGVILTFSISTLNELISDQLEPGAPPPAARLETLRQCSNKGFLAGVNAIPLLPFISDTDEEIEKIVMTAKEHGAHFLLAGGLTLFGNTPSDSKPLYDRFLQKNYPALIPAYESMFGNNYYQPRQYQQELQKKVIHYCNKHGIRNSIV